MSQFFQFKQFTIQQDQCAMKVGTDGVLLGAWAHLDNLPDSILDIGAGTGLLALQLAQRSNAQLIDAVEINPDAYQQCVVNFENSNWADRLFCYHASIQEFASEIEETYDLIVSNPPFYSENPSSKNQARDIARFTENLPFKMLLQSVAKLLSPKGIFAVILPHKEEENFIAMAQALGLFPEKICHVRGTKNSDIKRNLMTFSLQQQEVNFKELIIEISRHQYTKEYINLVKDFYLKM
ncbi:MAG: tRNA1(Val) (adenine(37)-N6)-methyltransferase [Flavobacteriales bacterium]